MKCATPREMRRMPQKSLKQERCYWILALVLSGITGILGLDRFYLGYRVLGMLKLVTGGGCLIWALVDFVLIAGNRLPDALGRSLVK